MCERVEGKIGANETPIGNMPQEGDFDMEGLDLSDKDFAELLKVDVDAFKSDLAEARDYVAKFGNKVPERLLAQLEALAKRLG